MSAPRRRRWAAGVLAACVVAVGLLGFAGPAAAQDATTPPPATPQEFLQQYAALEGEDPTALVEATQDAVVAAALRELETPDRVLVLNVLGPARSALILGQLQNDFQIEVLEAREAVQRDLIASVQSNVTTVFVFFAAALVYFMAAGFGLVETGLSRAKSAAHMMMKNLITVALGMVIFWFVGFAFAYGDGNSFIGTTGWFLSGTYESGYTGIAAYGDIALPIMFFFQAAFAATAATIISGAMAERTKLMGYLLIVVAMTAVIYPIVVHWVWGGGWLATFGVGFKDFAGSALVHMTGGIAALIGVILLGPRIGKYGPDGKPRVIPPHSVPFAVVGTFVLWFGWYGFNVGSALTANGAAFGPVAVTTTLGAGAGAVMAMLVTWLRDGKPDVSMTANGTLAGLVSVTAGCGFIYDWAALVIGAIGGILVAVVVPLIDKKVDDPVGAVSVHGVCGLWGTLAVGFFAYSTETYAGGLFYGGGGSQLWAQVVGIAAIAAFVTVASLVMFGIIKVTVGLRVSEEDELAGLDLAEHGMSGYNEDVELVGAGSLPAGR